MADVVEWFRRRVGKDGSPAEGTEARPVAPPGAPGSGESAKLDVEKASDLVDRTPPKAEEPADGFSEADIREALRDVRDPEIGRDLVSLNMIRGIKIEGPSVTVGVALTTPGCPMKHRITTDVRDRLLMIEGI